MARGAAGHISSGLGLAWSRGLGDHGLDRGQLAVATKVPKAGKEALECVEDGVW